MTVYVDKAQNAFGRMVMCHMVAENLDELHALAGRIGLRRSWFQGRASFPHYDVSRSKRELALAAGAVEIERRDLSVLMKRCRADPVFIEAWRACR